MIKTLTTLFTAAALVACAGTDSTIDQSTGDGVEGLRKACGGLVDLQCPKGYQCTYPTNNIPDYPGTCKRVRSCVQTKMCALTAHWDSKACACVPNSCVDNVACVIGTHWDSTYCDCEENLSCNTLECVPGYRCEMNGASATCVRY